MKTETELLVDKLNKDLSEAKKATAEDFIRKNYGHEDVYLLTWKELEILVHYIKNLRIASGRKP